MYDVIHLIEVIFSHENFTCFMLRLSRYTQNWIAFFLLKRLSAFQKIFGMVIESLVILISNITQKVDLF